VKKTWIVAMGVVLAAVAAWPMAGAAQAPSTAPAAKHGFTPSDWYKVKTLASPAMSPDGKWVAVQVTSVIESENKRVNEIWVVPATGGDAVRFSSPGVDSTNPRFNADGTLLIFNSTRPNETATLWAIRMDRPGGEFPYTAPREGNDAANDDQGSDFGGRGGGAGQNASSSPKDGSFVVTTGVEGAGGRGQGRAGGGNGRGAGRNGGANGAGANDAYSKMPPMARPPVNAITLPLDPERFDGMQITDQRYKANGRGYVPSTGAAGNGRGGRGGNGGDGPVAQILVDRKDGAGPKAITRTNYSHRNAEVSPDGKWIAFVADEDLRDDAAVRALRDEIAKLGTVPERDKATREKIRSDIFIIPATGTDAAPKRIKNAGNETGLAWSPNSAYLAYSANDGAGTDTEVYVTDVATGTTRNVTSEFRTDPGRIEWFDDGSLVMQLTVGGRNGLYRVDPKTGKSTELVGGARRVFGYSYDKAHSKVAYVATASDLPTELYVTDFKTGKESKLTDFNKVVNAEVAWSKAERFTYKSVGDVEIEAWLLPPYNKEAGKKYPLVLYIHGGPHSAYNEGWFDEFQNLAGAGMWVLYTNPRGSSGYGGEFTQMIRARWGDEDYMDLMKAVDIAAARPDVDSTKLGVTGGSYGGFMTTWITTKTDRFKAAQADRMIVNWVSWYGTSDAQSLTEGEFYGTPWEQWENYINMSPIKYVATVKTPTLLVQSEEDYRAPIADAEQWFNALRKLNVPAEFIRYPRSNHDLSRTGEPWLLTDRLNRIRQWFGYWLLDEKPQRAK
jgi:dipeptidyl aminopeptidase/acylaminoacyl peptidase